MKAIRRLLTVAFILSALPALADTLMPLPNQTGTFTGNVRGYWFTAPSNFSIKGLRVPTEAGGGAQSIAVLRFASPPPVFAATTNNFETLFLTQSNPDSGILAANITVHTGDVIGIFGCRGNVTSYGPNPSTSQIDGFNVTLARLGMQFQLPNTVPQQVWTEAGSSNANIGRIEMYYGPSVVTNTPLYTRGDVLPTAGVDPNIPADATWYGFGVPAVDQSGKVAFIGKWKNPKGSATTYGSGLFVDGALRVYAGQSVPGIPDVAFKSFRDPVISRDHLATIATLVGTGVDKTNDTVVIRVRPTGEVTVLAREGSAGENVDGATIKAFKSVSVSGGGTEGEAGFLYTASLNIGTGTTPVTAATDYAAWLFSADVTSLVVREGGTADGLDVGETVKTFVLLKSVSGSPQQLRGHSTGGTALFSAKLSSGRQALLAHGTGVTSAMLLSGMTLAGSSIPDAVWQTFGPVSDGEDRSAMSATLVNNVGGVVSPGTKGIFFSSGAPNGVWNPVVRVGDTAALDVTFKALKDPVLKPAGEEAVAFIATLAGGTVTPTTDTSVWWNHGGTLSALANEGGAAPGGGVWKKFTSLAFPGGTTGPLLLGALAQESGVDATNDVGVWGVDSNNSLQKLFREGDVIGANTVKNFAALKNVSGSPGTAHAFNNVGGVVWRAGYVGGLSGIVRTNVP